MALTVERLRNDNRFSGDNLAQFLLYLPFGICIFVFRIFLALILWVASIILPNKSSVRQMLSTLACWTFGVYVKVKGTRDPRCSVLVANYVSCLDSLAASHVLGTISLRKWKVPPFFASTLGIRNAAQFVRKEHFGSGVGAPLLLQPEGVPGTGRALLAFTDWPCSPPAKAQPLAITIERPFTNVTAQQAAGFPWRDALWFMLSPVTVFELTLLPPLAGATPTDLAAAIATHLQVEATDISFEQLQRAATSRRASPPAPAAPAPAPPAPPRRALQVKEVLPRVPLQDIMRDLAVTHSVDVTITNFLEGLTPYTPEPEPSPAAGPSQPKYVTPAPQAPFPKSAKERQLSFQERKAEMIAEARRRYIEKHGLNVAMNC